MSRMVPTTNRYTFCLTNREKGEAYMKVKVAQGAEVMDFGAGPSKADHTYLDGEVDFMEAQTEEIERSLTDSESNKSEAEFSL